MQAHLCHAMKWQNRDLRTAITGQTCFGAERVKCTLVLKGLQSPDLHAADQPEATASPHQGA